MILTKKQWSKQRMSVMSKASSVCVIKNVTKEKASKEGWLIRWKNRLLMAMIMSSPSLAFADSGGNKLGSILGGLVSFLTSGIAKTIFVIAIVGIGYGTLALGKIPKEKAVGTVIGIGIVFSAAYIAQQLGVGS